MNKAEYMKELIEKLGGFDEELVQEIVSDYEEHFATGANKGKSEEAVIAELGSVDELLAELQELQEETAKNHVKMPVKKQEQEKTVWETKQVVPAENHFGSEQWDGTIPDIDEEELNKEIEEATQQSEEATNKVDFNKAWNKAMQQVQDALDKIDLEESCRQAQEAIDKIDFDAIGEKLANMGLAFANAVTGRYSKTSKEEDFDECEDDLEDVEEEDWNEDDLEDVEEEDWDEDREYADEDEQHEEVVVTESVSGDTDGSSAEKCKNIVIDGKIADVFLVGTDEHEIRVEYENHGSLKDAMKYPFYSYQKEGTFYAGIKVNNEKRSGFFRFNSAEPEIELKIKVPKNMHSVEVQTTSGEMRAVQLVCDSVKLTSVSGDIATRNMEGQILSIHTTSGDVHTWVSKEEALSITTTSGDVTVHEKKGSELTLESKSGDIQLLNVEDKTIAVSTMSGDISVMSVEANQLEGNSRSGDITLNGAKAKKASICSNSGEIVGVGVEGEKFSFGVISGDARLNTIHCKNFKIESVSGDIAVREVTGETVQASSVSGDVTVWAAAKKYDFSTTSGELMVRFDEAAETRISVVSGSCELELPKTEEGYTVHFNSVSGSCDVNKEELCTEIKEQNGPGHRSKEMKLGNGQYPVSLRSVSGCVTIKIE